MMFEDVSTEFQKRFKIKDAEFRNANLDWDVLTAIYNDYESYKVSLGLISEIVSKELMRIDGVHSVRARVKDSFHLLDKIIRKSIRKSKETGLENYSISVDNYRSEITDLIGVRAIHLFKESASNIDSYIRDSWTLYETPIVYYRAGDSIEELIEKQSVPDDFDYKKHEYGYRSWHYLISSHFTKQENIVEIQVRSLFEEGWSEVDHQLRYPNNTDNLLLTEQLLVLNRIAGSADEMVDTIKDTKSFYDSMEAERGELKELISSLKQEIASIADAPTQEEQASMSAKLMKIETFYQKNPLVESLQAWERDMEPIRNNPGAKLQKQLQAFNKLSDSLTSMTLRIF